MAKYNIVKTKTLKFARYGGLSSVNQKGYDPNDDDFHAPPASRGFYAFVWPFVEQFLLGGDCTKDPRILGAKFTYVRDERGVIITDMHPEYESYYSKHGKYWSIQNEEYTKFYETHQDLDYQNYEVLWKSLNLPRYFLVQKPKPRIFEYNGVLWHHLGVHLKPHLILATKGEWVKSDMDTYRYALDREMHRAQKSMMSWCYNEKYKVIPTKEMALRRGCMDHLEVFLEKL